MADGIKISALPELTSIANDDLFVVVDTSVNTTKHITRANVLSSIDSSITSINNSISILQASSSYYSASIVLLYATASNHETRITNLEAEPGGYWTASGANIERYSDVYVEGTFYANEKHFYIDHPIKSDMKLVYGTLEGPENAVFLRGVLIDNNVIELPNYWCYLTDESTTTVHLTPIGKNQKLYVDKIKNNKVYIKKSKFTLGKIKCYYIVYSERKDIAKLITELPKK